MVNLLNLPSTEMRLPGLTLESLAEPRHRSPSST